MPEYPRVKSENTTSSCIITLAYRNTMHTDFSKICIFYGSQIPFTLQLKYIVIFMRVLRLWNRENLP